MKLADWSREELVDLVERMVAREPDLETTVDMPPPGRASGVVPGDVRAQVHQAFRVAARRGLRGGQALSRQLHDLHRQACRYAERGEIDNAIVTLAAVVEGICVRYAEIQDDESEVARTIDDCVTGLAAWVADAGAAARVAAFDALGRAAIWGPSYGVAEAAPEGIIAHSRDDERAAIVRRVERALARADSEWDSRQLGALLLRLRGPSTDQAEDLELLRETHNRNTLVERLLALHRPEDASQVLLGAPWVELPALADLLASAGHPNLAREVLEAILTDRHDQGCWLAMRWLYDLAVSRSDTAAQERWAVELFWQGPGIERWKLVRAAAGERVRASLHERLMQEGHYLLLARILLSEGPRDADQALNVLRMADPSDPETPRIGAKVAEALADRRPHEAASLWRSEAERLCKLGRPEEYESAVELIVRGRSALSAAGHPRLAREYLAAFRARHRRRRSLQRILDARAGDE